MGGCSTAAVRGKFAISFCFFILFASFAEVQVLGADSDPLADFCVAEPSSPSFNGFSCKEPSTVAATDFVFHGLGKAGNTSNPAGSAVTPAFAAQFHALNTLGLSLARLDFAPGGLVTLHTHPRATEVLHVIEGSLYVGFVDTTNKLFAQTLHEGDLFVFPKGLVHFELNVGKGPAVAIAALDSQNPGVQPIPNALFASDINDIVLEKAFGLDKTEVESLKNKFKH